MGTSDEIRVYIEQAYGQRYSKLGAIKLMARFGFAYKKPKLLPLQASSEAQEKFIADYEKLCTGLPTDEAVVFADAVYPEHQSRPAHGWFPKDHQPVLPANSGRKYELGCPAQLLMCLIYYRTYTSHVFLGLVFGVSSPTVCRVNRSMTHLLAWNMPLAG